MNLQAIYHEPKSKYAYAYDKETVHLRIRTQKDDFVSVRVIATDPFNWLRSSDGTYEFDFGSVQKIEMKKEYSNELFDFWFCELRDFKWLRIKYVFILNNGNAECFYNTRICKPVEENILKNTDFRDYFNFPFINEEDVYSAPEWVKDTVWYQIFPERFAASGDKEGVLEWGSIENTTNSMFFGGDLQGIIGKLDYIAEMGFTGIYFTPIFDSPSSHKYDTTDYFKIDPHFGDNETFKLLVGEAHKRNIKIMLDAVFNHCGFYHPFFQDVVKKGRASEYYEYFHILKDDFINFDIVNGNPAELSSEQQKALGYRTFAFTPNMPKWNTANPDARQYLLKVAAYWIEEYDIDGWRLDVSNEVSHDFWREFRKRVKAIKNDIYIVGENWDDSYPWLMGDQFDSVMNYGFLNSVWGFMSDNNTHCPKLDAEQFKNTLIKSNLSNYPKNVSPYLFNMIDSHDTVRILSVCGDSIEKVKLAYVLQMTYPGSPCVYYGGEIGLSGEMGANRKCMIWDESKQNMDLKEHIKKLIVIRGTCPAAKAVDIEWLICRDGILIYKKCSDDESMFVIMNNSQVNGEIDLPGELKGLNADDIYAHASVQLGSRLALPPYKFYLLSTKEKYVYSGGRVCL